MSDSIGKKRAADLNLFTYRVYNDLPDTHYYKADDIHKLLGKGTMVYGCQKPDVAFSEKQFPVDDCCGPLIGLSPIPVESEERKLLRGLIEQIETEIAKFGMIARSPLLDRAKKLIGDK